MCPLGTYHPENCGTLTISEDIWRTSSTDNESGEPKLEQTSLGVMLGSVEDG